MDVRPLRILLVANMITFLVVCVAFLVHVLGAGVYPDGVESWMDDNQWLMWTAAGVAVASALAVALLDPIVAPRGQGR
ncbi:hypothetical protein BAY61_05340 [Prauserella marina]|uniref:Uncharacterized protein n=1 Tax=Prauserella marina TaxID=530584 RepID=A0A222VKP2_9PSEU|nr:hypothetical protein [Prauserella marina]ASR34509.1 hypothetical protein BAY61_05340 [Prauserella marina]PWV85890.1 hypothetical protein DES30_1011920 [Prauserella marina]SDC43025.1 hypothetical protein SAMN05421630_10272 [Prauserella marina]